MDCGLTDDTRLTCETTHTHITLRRGRPQRPEHCPLDKKDIHNTHWTFTNVPPVPPMPGRDTSRLYTVAGTAGTTAVFAHCHTPGSMKRSRRECPRPVSQLATSDATTCECRVHSMRSCLLCRPVYMAVLLSAPGVTWVSTASVIISDPIRSASYCAVALAPLRTAHARVHKGPA